MPAGLAEGLPSLSVSSGAAQAQQPDGAPVPGLRVTASPQTEHNQTEALCVQGPAGATSSGEGWGRYSGSMGSTSSTHGYGRGSAPPLSPQPAAGLSWSGRTLLGSRRADKEKVRRCFARDGGTTGGGDTAVLQARSKCTLPYKVPTVHAAPWSKQGPMRCCCGLISASSPKTAPMARKPMPTSPAQLTAMTRVYGNLPLRTAPPGPRIKQRSRDPRAGSVAGAIAVLHRVTRARRHVW